eukprot:12306231-Karenia_brevis.AAC.1
MVDASPGVSTSRSCFGSGVNTPSCAVLNDARCARNIQLLACVMGMVAGNDGACNALWLLPDDLNIHCPENMILWDIIRKTVTYCYQP